MEKFWNAWPKWALDILLTMSVFLVITTIATQFLYTPPKDETEEKTISSRKGTKEYEEEKTKAADVVVLKTEFDGFRRKYIMVYLVIMLADWMQGTHMYTLYLSYNVNVSALFITGFLSGAIFAPFLGSFVDKFGRKNSCIVYCVLEIIINTLEHSHDFNILLFGRVLGGISTNLLFSAFESWMTTEHRKKGFPEEWMSTTYSQVCDVKFDLKNKIKLQKRERLFICVYSIRIHACIPYLIVYWNTLLLTFLFSLN